MRRVGDDRHAVGRYLDRDARVDGLLGKAGADLGGTTLDQWIFQEALRQNRRSDADEEVRQISNALLVELSLIHISEPTRPY